MSHGTENEFVFASLYLGQIFKAKYRGQKNKNKKQWQSLLEMPVTKALGRECTEPQNVKVRGNFTAQLLQR